VSVQVYLVAAATLNTSANSGLARFLSDRRLEWDPEPGVTDSERLVEAAGRVCYMSFGPWPRPKRQNAEYLANLIRQGHDSVLEHATFTLLITGASRALSHQIVRHRIGFAYSQLSQQYHEESDAAFAEPPLVQSDPKMAALWRQQIRAAVSAYKELLDSATSATATLDLPEKERTRLARSIARGVLPNSTTTVLMVTGNARAWRHVLKTRGAIAGDLEMREYCIAIFNVLLAAAPNLFQDFETASDALGRFVRLRGTPVIPANGP
jgi:thymidylate synthase (FAD)